MAVQGLRVVSQHDPLERGMIVLGDDPTFDQRVVCYVNHPIFHSQTYSSYATYRDNTGEAGTPRLGLRRPFVFLATLQLLPPLDDSRSVALIDGEFGFMTSYGVIAKACAGGYPKLVLSSQPDGLCLIGCWHFVKVGRYTNIKPYEGPRPWESI
jgi:hypothetical protein